MLTAAVIFTPAAFAGDKHDREPGPSRGLQLAIDIVGLVRAVLAPPPTPVIVAPAEPVETTEIITVPVTIPDYGCILYKGEFVPYFEGWAYHHDDWHWIGTGLRPAVPPRWKPREHHHAPERPGVVVLPERHHVPGRYHEAPHHEPAPAVRRDDPRRESVRPVVVRPEKKDAGCTEAPKTTRPEKKDAGRTEAPKTNGQKKGR